MYITMLGRQPKIGMAELERVFGNVSWFSDNSALVDTASFDIQHIGGTVKAGRVVAELPRGDWRQTSMQLTRAYIDAWRDAEHKITLGISAYGFDISPRDVQKTGLILKSKLKEKGVSLRLVPNEAVALGTATSHHNKLGLSNNKVELLVVRGHGGKVIIAESTGAQNVTALARRDRERPARDAFVGMLPPKLAQIMINLAIPHSNSSVDTPRILDPFCGTGVVLQESALLGYAAYGTDLSEKMVDYSRRNMDWLAAQSHDALDYTIEQGDAMDVTWTHPIDAVVCETYLGQPFSAPPSDTKLQQVRGNCDHIISAFLKNIGSQIRPGTPLCIAVPAWNDGHDNFTHLPLIKKIAQLGYKQLEFKNVDTTKLLYYRPGQVVARELLVLKKA